MKNLVFSAVATLAALLFLLPASPVAAAGIEAQVVAVETTWKGQQYLGSDAKGRVYVLSPQESKVYPLRDGELQEPRKLSAAPMTTPAPVLDAAMDLAGDWVGRYGGEVRWFRAGKEVSLPPLHWPVAAVTLLNGNPVVAVFPSPRAGTPKAELRPVPLLMTPSGSRWSVLAESERDRHAGRDDPDPIISDTVHLLTDSRDTLWVAYKYHYRLLHFSPAGRELMSLEVDGAETHHRDETEVEDTRIGFEKERVRHADPEKVGLQVNTAVAAVLDLFEGRDGRIYLLAAGAGEDAGRWFLDRFDPVLGTLERAPLAFRYDGAVSVASGRDGLYLARFNGRGERLWIPWEAIEGAEWEPVQGVELDGFAAEAGGRTPARKEAAAGR